MVSLPDRMTDAGIEVRILMAECRGPSLPGYSSADAKTCMEFMHIVLWNRVADPRPFGAKQATLLAVITAAGQFAGFENYPDYSGGIRQNLQRMLDIANDSKDSRNAQFTEFIQIAIDVAKNRTILDPTPGKLVGWRTGGSGSPGGGFKLFRTVAGTDFYYQVKPEPKAARHK